MNLNNDLDDITRQVDLRFAGLSPAQLNWKPEPSQWSIGQCLDHLITSNSTYFSGFDRLVQGNYRLSFFQKMNPFKRSFGPMMVKMLAPGGKKKFKAPKIFEPTSSSVPGDIVKRFADHQDVMRSYFSSLQKLDTNQVVVSPVTAALTYSLSDALQLLVTHERRHLAQAIAISNHPNFPQ